MPLPAPDMFLNSFLTQGLFQIQQKVLKGSLNSTPVRREPLCAVQRRSLRYRPGVNFRYSKNTE